MLTLVGSVDLPAQGEGRFDHGDVHRATGRVFVAHTANGTVEVIDNDNLTELPQDPIEVYPGTYGGVESPIAYADGTVPIAYADGTVFATYIDLPQYQGATGSDPDRQANLAEGTGGLVAIDAATGAVTWEAKIPTIVVGGATVANDVVFTSGLDGFVRAYDVATGPEIWSYEAESGFNAPPAVAGDMVFAAGFVKLPQVGAAPAATPEAQAAPVSKLIAFRLGDASAATATGEGGQTAQGVIAMVDINFDPKEITIPANTDVTIELVNNGAAVHNFNVDALNIHSGDFQPGQTGTVTINAAPGDYQYYCAIPGHKEAGMVGTIHVQ